MTRRARGFTLVELLVVIAIIGVLVSLLLPAVNSAREAARRTQCMNQIRQLTLAALIHEETHKLLPTGGWGWWWVGDADRGFDEDQPGGWIFNVMPYVEENNSYDLCKDGDRDGLSQEQLLAVRGVITKPISLVNCPSRRAAIPYPKPIDGTFIAYNSARNRPAFNVAGRTDYAANAGDQDNNELGSNDWPSSYGQAANFNWGANASMTGISFFRSEIRLRHVVDGTSKTYMIAEKYLNPTNYTTGRDGGDNETWCTGFNNDNFRVAFDPPMRDRIGFQDTKRMGSAHSGGFNASHCDGSVRNVSFDIELNTHQRLANRRNSKTIQTTGGPPR